MKILTLKPYVKEFENIFQEFKQSFQPIFPSAEIHHIGSTAVPGLGGKGIIDILIAIPDWHEKSSVVEKLQTLDFNHIHPEENQRIFLSKLAETSYGDIHIHLTYIGSSEYNSLLTFRDYLRVNHDEAERYMNLKDKWLKDAGGDRKAYSSRKNDYIAKVLKNAATNFSRM